MNLPSILLWGFVATAIQTTLGAGSLRFGLSRMSVPFMLGTIFTADRDRANLIGFGVHMLNGWLFALVYGLIFESLGRATWYIGGALGLIHSLFVLLVAIPLLPAVHPRMASERHGPETTGGLEPPGLLALHYGYWTPLVVVLAHLVYGTVLGAFYTLST